MGETILVAVLLVGAGGAVIYTLRRETRGSCASCPGACAHCRMDVKKTKKERKSS